MNPKVEAKLKDIAAHPENHKHTFQALQACCLIDGVLDMRVMDAHAEHADLGTNGGRRCDVVSGPCACGAWH